jgi:hypothetical protein
MRDAAIRPKLYVGHDAESERALVLLREAGFEVEVRTAPDHYRIAFGTPVLFGLSNRYEGTGGILAFIENARILGYQNQNHSESKRINLARGQLSL